jgi:transposase InsO family protein
MEPMLALMRLIDERSWTARSMARVSESAPAPVAPPGRSKPGCRADAQNGAAGDYQKLTPAPNPDHRVYPYLLHDLTIMQTNQVWCFDITYIPMRRGLLLAPVADVLVVDEDATMPAIEVTTRPLTELDPFAIGDIGIDTRASLNSMRSPGLRIHSKPFLLLGSTKPNCFLYLVAIMDLHSCRVLSWRLSNMMDAKFCTEALEEALVQHGRPDIFNTDQGCQLTSV